MLTLTSICCFPSLLHPYTKEIYRTDTLSHTIPNLQCFIPLFHVIDMLTAEKRKRQRKTRKKEREKKVVVQTRVSPRYVRSTGVTTHMSRLQFMSSTTESSWGNKMLHIYTFERTIQALVRVYMFFNFYLSFFYTFITTPWKRYPNCCWSVQVFFSFLFTLSSILSIV